MSEFTPALCRVGVFAVVVRPGDGCLEVLVNVRTDQGRQRQLAGLPDTWLGVIVDLPGGTLQIGDLSLEGCLEREIAEETGGCDSRMVSNGFLGPFALIKADTGSAERPHDLALAAACELVGGEPRANAEASEHRWVTWRQLVAEDEVRLPGKLGVSGRMGRMIKAVLESFAVPLTPTAPQSVAAQ